MASPDATTEIASSPPRATPTPPLAAGSSRPAPSAPAEAPHPYYSGSNPSILAYPHLPLPTSSEQAAIHDLTPLLGRPLQITICDGRIFIGYLAMIDRDQNFLLSDAEEFPPLTRIQFSLTDTVAEREEKEEARRKEEEIRMNREMYWPRSEPSRPDGWGGREVGLALIKGKDIVKVEMEGPWPSAAAASFRDG